MITNPDYDPKSFVNALFGHSKFNPSKEMTKIGNKYPSNLLQMENEISSCMGWTFAVGKVIQSNRSSMKNNNKAKQVLLSAPKPNKQYKYPFKDYETIRPFIKVGFDSWVSMGKVTPQSLRDNLKKEMN